MNNAIRKGARVSVVIAVFFGFIIVLNCNTFEILKAREDDQDTEVFQETEVFQQTDFSGPADFCDGSGPTVHMEDPSGDAGVRDVCTGEIAEHFFRFALCSCKNVYVAGILTTNSFDSSVGEETKFYKWGSPVGGNGDFTVAGGVNIGGTLILTGANGVTFPGLVDIFGDLKVKNTLTFLGYLNVGRDAYVGGNFVNFGPADIARDLYLTGRINKPNWANTGGKTIEGPLTFYPPCACEDTSILGIEQIVTNAEQHNDNDELLLDPMAFTALTGDVKAKFSCGRLYIRGIGGTGNLTLEVLGKVAVFVDGDVSLKGVLGFEFGDSAEIDVFVRGNLNLSGNRFGSLENPSAVRFYVAGSHSVTIAETARFGAHLYAPRAQIIVSGNTHIYGSIFAGDFFTLGAAGIHYDRKIQASGTDCNATDSSKPLDDDCLPYDGLCGKDADCCEPLVCEDTHCRALIVI